MGTTNIFMQKSSKYPPPNFSNKGDLLWLSGFLEGEGCFTFSRSKNTIGVVVSGVDEDTIKRAHSIMGGSFRLAKKTVTGKQVYEVCTTSRRYAYALMVALFALMGNRRKLKILECLTFYANSKGTQKCHA